MTVQSRPPEQASPARPALRWLADRELFTPRPPSRTTPRQVIFAVGAVIVATVLSLARTGGPGALNSVWAEDGQHFLADAYNLSFFQALTTSFNGYWHTIPRLLTSIVPLFPVKYGPAIISIEAAALTAGLALFVYIASRAYFAHPALRLLVAVPLVLATVGDGWVENNVATLQFPLLYGLFWLLLFVPRTRWGRIALGIAVALIALTSALTVVMVPLAIVRVVKRRDRLSWILLAGLTIGSLIELACPALGGTSRTGIGTPRLNPVWALYQYAVMGVPSAMFGENWMYGRMEPGVCPTFVVDHLWLHRLLIVGAWLIIAVVVADAVRRRTGPAWSLAAISFAGSALLFSASTMELGCPANRYFVAPALLLFTGLAALLRREPSTAAAGATPRQRPALDDASPAARPRWGRPAVLIVGMVALIAVVGVANFRTDDGRGRLSARWTTMVKTAHAVCLRDRAKAVTMIMQPPMRWSMTVDCSVLKD
jgi:hypothetical protein